MWNTSKIKIEREDIMNQTRKSRSAVNIPESIGNNKFKLFHEWNTWSAAESHDNEALVNLGGTKLSLSLGSNLNLQKDHDKDQNQTRPQFLTRRDTFTSINTIDGCNNARINRSSRFSRTSQSSKLSNMSSEDMTYSWFCFLAIIIILFISIFVVNYIVNNW